jgi:hypothetical protein
MEERQKWMSAHWVKKFLHKRIFQARKAASPTSFFPFLDIQDFLFLKYVVSLHTYILATATKIEHMWKVFSACSLSPFYERMKIFCAVSIFYAQVCLLRYRVARFLGLKHKKCTKMATKYTQIVFKHSELPKIYLQFPFEGPLKYSQIGIYLFENICTIWQPCSTVDMRLLCVRTVLLRVLYYSTVIASAAVLQYCYILLGAAQVETMLELKKILVDQLLFITVRVSTYLRRTLASWVILYFGQVFENRQST